jgi:GNAT superfamily N-acetyltransferase
MSSIEVREFRRSDREQVTALVNAHAAAVVPGVSVSVNTVLARLEREPGELVVDPWVVERVTLVAGRAGNVDAAAHLLRYAADARVGETYRDAGEIRWLVFRPASEDAADALVAACLAQLERWGVARQYADGAVPAPGVYGVPDQWPHVRALYERAGFVHEGRTEIVFLASLNDLPRASAPAGLELRRSVGTSGTRLTAVLGGEAVGYVEVETFEDGQRLPRGGGLADVGNLVVAEAHRRRGVATWLLAQAADWLRLAGVARLLDYAFAEEDDDCRAFLEAAGFHELTRTARGWRR